MQREHFTPTASYLQNLSRSFGTDRMGIALLRSQGFCMPWHRRDAMKQEGRSMDQPKASIACLVAESGLVRSTRLLESQEGLVQTQISKQPSPGATQPLADPWGHTTLARSRRKRNERRRRRSTGDSTVCEANCFCFRICFTQGWPITSSRFEG